MEVEKKRKIAITRNGKVKAVFEDIEDMYEFFAWITAKIYLTNSAEYRLGMLGRERFMQYDYKAHDVATRGEFEIVYAIEKGEEDDQH